MNRDYITSSCPIWMPLITFSCLIALAKTSSTTLVKAGILAFFLILNEVLSFFHHWTWCSLMYAFCYAQPCAFWTLDISHGKTSHYLTEDPLCGLSCFSLLLLLCRFSWLLTVIITCLRVGLWLHLTWSWLGFLDVYVCVFPKAWEVFGHYFFKYLLCPSFLPGTLSVSRR